MFRRKTAVFLIILLIQFKSDVSIAQDLPKPSQPNHPKRLLVIGNMAFFDSWTPSVTAGTLFQVSFKKTKIETGQFGNEVILPPSLYAHLLASGGMEGFFDDYELFLQFGANYRLNAETFKFMGIVAQAVLPEKSLGPVLRLEILDNIGVQAGYLFGKDHKGIFVSIDFFKTLFSDLELP